MSSKDSTLDHLDIGKVKELASLVPNIRLLSVNKQLKVISFANELTKCRFVVYERGTVVVTSSDPSLGTTQSVRREVNYRSLVDLFREPLYKKSIAAVNSHGTKRKSDSIQPKKTNVVLDDDCEFDEQPVKKVSSFIKPTHLDGKHQIFEIATKKEEDKRWRESLSPKKSTEAVQAATTELSRKVNARGSNCFWKLRHTGGFPESVHDVSCIAIAQGGFVAVMDDGTCVYNGVPASIANILEVQYKRNIAYIALGEYGQHYILLKNGREYYSGSPSFEKAIRGAKSTAKVVAFGDSVSYFVQFEDGMREWSAPFSRRMSDDLKDCQVHSLWIGTPPPTRGAAELPYSLVYQPAVRVGNGPPLHTYAGLPYEVQDWIQYKTQKSTQIKQILTDGDCFVIRYS